MPDTNINLSNIHRRSLLKRDYRRSVQSNQAFWDDYREKQKDENVFQKMLNFGVGIIGGVIGFATGGLPGAKAGFSWGTSIAKIGYLADNREFDAEEYLYKNKKAVIGKFNTLENTKLFNEAVNSAKDDKLADQLDAGFSLLQAGWNAGQAGGDTVHGVSKSDWDNMKWFGEGGRVKTMFEDIRTSNLEKLASLMNNRNASPKILSNMNSNIGISAPNLLNPSSSGGIGISSPNFITFNPLQNENAIRGAFGDVLSDIAIKTIANKKPNELLDILEEATESNDTEKVLNEKLNIDLKDMERIYPSAIRYKDETRLGNMVQYGKTVDDSLISGDELNDRMLDYARSFKAPVVKPTMKIEDDIEDLNNLAMENLTNPALEVLDDFPNLTNENMSAASELSPEISSGGYKYPIKDFRVPTSSGEEIYGLQEIKEALGISLYNNDIDSWDIQNAIDSYLENPNRNKPDGVDESVWNWLLNINSGDF